MGIANATHDPTSARRARLWLAAYLIAATAFAIPVAWRAYDELTRVNQQARARLIEHHRLWETERSFQGRPENWTRFASRLLNDRQLLARLTLKYGAQAEDIEREYRRDLAIARTEVVVVALAVWVLPVAALYGLVLLRRRGRTPPTGHKVEPASASDPRYRPPA